MSKHITVTVDGYGVIKVKKPKKLTRATAADMVGKAVAETLSLVSPRTQGERFHPALGRGGYLK